MNMKSSMQSFGLTTKSALKQLEIEITSCLTKYSKTFDQTTFIWNSLKRNLFWLVWMFLSSLSVIMMTLIAISINPALAKNDSWYYVLIVYFGLVTILNWILFIWISVQHEKTKIAKIWNLRAKIKEMSEYDGTLWQLDAYPSLYMPQAPNVHFQWAYRDGCLVSVPSSLLVKGDLILLRPGQDIYAACEMWKEDASVMLQEAQKYCEEYKESNMMSSPTERQLLQCETATVLQSPFVTHLETYLTKNFTSFNKSVPELYLLFALKVMIAAVTCSFFLSFVATGVHYILLVNKLYSVLGLVPKSNRTFNYGDPIFLPFQSLGCGIPVLLPIVWILMQSYAIGRFYLVYNKSLSMGGHLADSVESVNELKAVEDRAVSLTPSFKEILSATRLEFLSQDFSRQNLLLTMGSVSSVCCVDKKGIISHSHATPEKIFFFRKRHRHSHLHSHRLDRKRSDTSFAHCIVDNQSTVHSLISSVMPPQQFRGRSESEYSSNAIVPSAVTMHSLIQSTAAGQSPNDSYAVTLDVSPNPADPYIPVFSDPRWQRYKASLKPIGLNILLNNCHDSVVPQYIRFADHLSAISANSKKSIAVVNRRCLCGVASEIGFSKSAINSFRIKSTLGCFRQNCCSSNNNRFFESSCANDPNSTPYSQNMRYKSPLPHLFSTIAEQVGCGGYQLMSQGTADLLVDLCTDYWDGKDVVVMTESERSRVLDFYNRNIFASYCVALAYSPLLEKIELSEMDAILELPEHWSNRDKHIEAGDNDKNKSYSAESLMSRFGMESVKDSQSCQRLLSSQVFLGMISMQYQAMSDVVEIIDRLEEACIRFVHFSKENQLRSRVFAERLGLESGWNCHISLAASQTSLNQSSRYHSSNAISAGTNKVDCSYSKKVSDNSVMEMVSLAADKVDDNMASTEKTNSNLTVGMHYGSAPHLYRNKVKELDEDLSHDKINVQLVGDDNSEIQFMAEQQPVDTESKCSEEENDRLASEVDPLITEESAKEQECDAAEQREQSERGNSESTSGCSENDETNQEENIIEPIPSYLVTTDKSKLPRGINSIRPHLENIDNVPLQVSLFTDCTPPAVKEMCKIMQDYGEVVSVVGSSLTLWNMETFCEADCSIALVPIFPSVCVRHQKNEKLFKTTKSPSATAGIHPDYSDLTNRDCASITPIELAASLGSLPCSINGKRQNGFPVLTLINESRYLVNNLLISVNFFLVCLWAFSLCQGLGSALLFFQLFTPRHILWMQIVFVPALTVAVLGRRVEQGKPVKAPPQKRLKLFTKKKLRKTCIRFALTSTFRFLPSVIVCIFVAWLNVNKLASGKNPLDFGFLDNITNDTEDSVIPILTVNIEAVVSEFAFSQMSLYIIIISFSYAIYGHPLISARPKLNPCWFLVVVILIIVHLLQVFVSCASQSTKFEDFLNLHYSSWLISSLWCLVLIMCNEFISIRERLSIKAENRLAKLYFGTKLGMYSPV